MKLNLPLLSLTLAMLQPRISLHCEAMVNMHGEYARAISGGNQRMQENR
jgi:hypothetical protein